MGWLMAIDYLVSRDEVDKEKVGITGNSGTGHLLHGYLQLMIDLKYLLLLALLLHFFQTLKMNYHLITNSAYQEL
jgi:cephalosporin-C deacetylase-like acetyl esterase